ncbi:MAG TPA: NUDIX hydrolase [Hyphomicrobiaceae bacterium]|nr:NUDIX hydrolase [Hyphomicrobiaceae bacterium]
MNGREDHWPKAAVSTVVVYRSRVLLVERGKGAPRGLWSFPGGHVEPGETVRDAAKREVAEETGLDIEITGIAGVRDVIYRHTDGSLRLHYVLNVFTGRLVTPGHDPRFGGDVMDARFVPLAELGRYTLVDGIAEVLAALGLVSAD